MIFITGPLYSGKRTFAQTLPGKALADVQQLEQMPPTARYWNGWQTALLLNTISSSPPR